MSHVDLVVYNPGLSFYALHTLRIHILSEVAPGAVALSFAGFIEDGRSKDGRMESYDS